MIEIEFYQLHFMFAVRTFQRIVAERRENGGTPLIETTVDTMFVFVYRSIECGINLPMSCVQAAIANHFKVLFRDVANQASDEIHGRNGFFCIFFIFLTVVVKSNQIAVIAIDSGSSDGWSTEITTDVFEHYFGIAKIWFSVNIKSLFVVVITFGLYLFKGKSDPGFQFIQKSGAESIAQKRVIKIFDMTPETVVVQATFRNEAMNMRILFEIPAEGMQKP